MATNREATTGSLVLGRYRIVSHLARGGMGDVYLARTEGAQGFTRPVVIKRVVPELAADEATAQSFVREARILANLQHPGIVNVIDFDEEDDAYVMVLEYVHGYNLGQWHKYVVDTRHSMPVDHAIYIMTRVLDALHYAHTFVRADGTPMQIIHRDVSPANILIDTQALVKLLDFGIARANETGEYKTHDGVFKGKLTYAAPEVFDGHSATSKSDLYSAGVVLYQLLLGENPFRGKDTAETVRRVLTEDLPPISIRREDIPLGLDEALARALAKNPDDRFPTAAAFAEALRAVRPRREEEFHSELVNDVWADFHGDMPKQLGLVPLQVRDATWRAAQPEEGTPRRAPLSSTPPPQTQEQTATLRDPLPAAVESARAGARPADTTVDKPSAVSNRPSGAARGKTPAAVWLAATAAIVASGAAAFMAFGRPQAPASSSFVVVERQTEESPRATAEPSAVAPPVEPTPAPSTDPATELAAEPAAPPKTQTANASPPPGSGPRKPDPAELSRMVARERGRIESCFLQHVKDVDGRPQVSVRFRVSTSGAVEGADLSPAALGGTPLGQCILGVARSVKFGALSEPVSFTIPITARRVK